MKISKFSSFFLLIVSIVFSNSCSEQKLNDDKDLKFGKLYLGDKLTSHFPLDYVTHNYSIGIDTVAYYNTIEMSLALFESDADQRIKKLLNEHKEKKKYVDTDNCIIVLNDFMNEKEILNIEDIMHPNPDIFNPNFNYNKIYLSKISNKCESKYQVIPNFWEGYYYGSNYKDQISNTRSHLDSGFKFIILDSQFSDKKIWSKKLDPLKSYMPTPVKHGYSKGIAFNEQKKVIIYWVILW